MEPAFKTYPQSLSIEKGATAKFSAIIDGKVENIFWMKDGKELFDKVNQLKYSYSKMNL